MATTRGKRGELKALSAFLGVINARRRKKGIGFFPFLNGLVTLARDNASLDGAEIVRLWKENRLPLGWGKRGAAVAGK